MSELSPEELGAMGHAVEDWDARDDGSRLQEAVWIAAREYSKQREEKLRGALGELFAAEDALPVDGLRDFEEAWPRFWRAIQTLRALAENGDSEQTEKPRTHIEECNLPKDHGGLCGGIIGNAPNGDTDD